MNEDYYLRDLSAQTVPAVDLLFELRVIVEIERRRFLNAVARIVVTSAVASIFLALTIPQMQHLFDGRIDLLNEATLPIVALTSSLAFFHLSNSRRSWLAW